MAQGKRYVAALALALLAPAAASAETVPDETAFTVTALLADAAAEEMDRRVTAVMERRFGAAPGLAFMVSITGAGESRVILKFKPDVAEDAAARAVEAAIEQMRGGLPAGAGAPILARMSMTTLPAAFVGFSSEDRSQAELTEMLVAVERELFAASDAFEAIVRYGAHDPMLSLRLDLLRLAANGLTVRSVQAALALNGIDSQPLGEFAFRLLRNGRPADPEDVARVTMRNGLGNAVPLHDVGIVAREAQSDGLIARFNGRSVVLLTMSPRNGISPLDAVRAVHRGLSAVAGRLPGGVRHAVGYPCGACADAVAREPSR